MIKRIIDFNLALVCLLVFFTPGIIIAVIIRITSKGPSIFWSRRIGLYGKSFVMPKFRTMYLNSPEVASDELKNPEYHTTGFGRVLRKTSLDELPQLILVLTGKMSLVGPRPALVSQNELNEKRSELGIYSLRPGITGWAQVNGRDNLSLTKKVEFDLDYLQRQSLLFDLKIILITVISAIKGSDISH